MKEAENLNGDSPPAKSPEETSSDSNSPGKGVEAGSSLANRARNWINKLDSRIRRSGHVPQDVGVNAGVPNQVPAPAENDPSATLENVTPLSISGGQATLGAATIPLDSDHVLREEEFRLAAAMAATSMHAGTAAKGIRNAAVKSIIAGIRAVSSERDRDEILRWFMNAREVLANSELKKSEAVAELYKSVSAIRVGQLLTSIAMTSLRSFQASKLPLALKIALPVTAVGTAIVGAQGAGIAAFGGAIGAPVALLLFLGTAGATSIIEAFVRDRTVRDPLTKLMLTFVAFETTRRAKKELLAAMRADAMTPLRSAVPEDDMRLLEFLLQMDPIAFERHVMSFFDECGHPTGLTARSNDFGVDGYMFHPDGVVVVQCKRYALDNAVGRPAIQQFKGVVEEQKAFRGYFVTTSRFTDEAHESAAKSDRIALVDGAVLCNWHTRGFQFI